MQHRGAFTLVEMLIALAATSVLLAALATAIPTALRAREAAAERLGRTEVTRAVLGRLEHELAAVVAERFEVVDGAAPMLRFSGGGEPGDRLTYSVERGRLVRAVAPRFAVADAPTAPGDVVLDGVAALELAAFDGRGWRRAWDADDPPMAMRVRLVFGDGEALELVAPVPVGRPRRDA